MVRLIETDAGWVEETPKPCHGKPWITYWGECPRCRDVMGRKWRCPVCGRVEFDPEHECG